MDEIKVDDYILAIPKDIPVTTDYSKCFYIGKVKQIYKDRTIGVYSYIFFWKNYKPAKCGEGAFTKRYKKITEAQYQYLLMMKEIPNELKCW